MELKYLKYKHKYIQLKKKVNNQIGGSSAFLNTDNHIKDNSTIMLFKSDMCIHCTNFKDIWNKLYEKYNTNINFLVYDIKNDNHKKMFSNFNIDAYPTIYIVDINQVGIEYKGDRNLLSNTLDNLIKK